MSAPARATGATRPCPHCRAVILESAAVCPQCRHHLRAGARREAPEAGGGTDALRVTGTLEGPAAGTIEYTVVVTIRNERGEEVGRQLVGVGALRHGERREVAVQVQVATR